MTQRGKQTWPSPFLGAESGDNFSALHRWGLVIAVLLALGLRLWGGPTFGLPFLYDPDESAFVSPSLKMVWDGELNPGWFGHPGSTVIYLNAAVYKLLAMAAPALGLFDTMRGFRSYILNDPTLIYVLARSMYVLIGAATVWMLYHLARPAFGRATALLAATVLAVMALHIEYSQMVRTDIIVTALAVLAGQQAIALGRDGALKRYVWSGVLVGMAVATKYPAVLIGVMIFVAHLLAEGVQWRAAWKLGVCGLTALVSLFVCSPFLFIDRATVQRDLAAEAWGGHLSAAGVGFWGNLAWYMEGPFPNVFGWLGCALALLGLWAGFRRRRADTVVLASFLVVYVLAISSLSLHWERWIIPVLPFVALFAATGASALATFLSQRIAAVPSKGWLAVVGAALVLPMLFQTVQQGLNRTGPDTRAQAREWLLANVPAKSRVLIEAYGPQVPKDHYILYNAGRDHVVRRPQGLRSHVIPSGFLSERGTLQALAAEGVEYLVLSSFYERFKGANNPEFLPLVTNYETLLQRTELVAEFVPVTGRLADPLNANREGGPHLRILKMPPPQTPRP
jgi:4-amino-4-deoxy-L-arabinose transferase-like glycosyltransferase